MTQLCRTPIQPLLINGFARLRGRNPHPGLLLTKGLASFPEGEKVGEIKANHLRQITGIAPSDLYRHAFARWKKITGGNGARFAHFEGRLCGRLYIGVVRDNAVETGITVSHSYGMPMIPGSVVKGLCRACAGDWLDNEEARRWLFGNEWGEGEETAETGGLIFHDAWWVPEGKPFVAETVTVHHAAYYGSEGKTPATDFDSPNPAPQIAAQGSFYFVIEGPPLWTRLASRLLKEGLRNRGIGGKRSSGYGFFVLE